MKLISQRLRSRIAALLCLFMLSPGSLLLAAETPYPLNTVVFLRGKVRWTNAYGEEGLVTKGQRMADGTSLRSFKNSAVKIRLHDGNDIILGANSEITIGKVKKNGFWVNQVSFFGGTVRGLVHKLRNGDRLEVITSNAVAAVKGTDFIMKLQPLPDAEDELKALLDKPSALQAAAFRYLPKLLQAILLPADARAAGTGPGPNLEVLVLSSKSIGMLLASKNGKAGVQIPAGAKAKISPSGMVKAGAITQADLDGANAEADGAVPPVSMKDVPALAKVQIATEAKFMMLQALADQQVIQERAKAADLEGAIKKLGADSPKVAELKAVQEAQGKAAETYLQALSEGVAKMADLDQKIQTALEAGQPADELLAERKVAESGLAKELAVLLPKLDELNQKSQAMANEAVRPGLPPKPSLPSAQAPKDEKAGGTLLEAAIGALTQVRQEQARQDQQDAQGVKNDLYTGASFVDRNNVRVQMSQVVLRPDAATVQRVRITQRNEGPQAGQSLFSHSQTFNQALPEDWTTIVGRPLNDPANIAGGTPAFYRLSEQVAMRSPAGCLLCITQQFDLPQLSGTWSQGFTERTAVMGADVGFVHYDAAGGLLAGSDTISVTVTEDTVNKSWNFNYFNVDLGVEMYTAKVFLIDGKGGFTDTAAFSGGPLSSLRSFHLGFEGKFFELAISAPGFNGQEIDVLVPSTAFLEAF